MPRTAAWVGLKSIFIAKINKINLLKVWQCNENFDDFIFVMELLQDSNMLLLVENHFVQNLMETLGSCALFSKFNGIFLPMMHW